MRKLTLLIFMATSFFASAKEEWIPAPNYSWEQGGTVMMISLNEEEQTGRFFVAQAKHNLNGKLGLFFTLVDTSRDTCNYRELKDVNNTNQHILEGTRIQKFNGQPIRMLGFCVKENDVDYAYIYLTPETERGKRYVTNSFIKSNSVLVESDNAEGFDKITVTALGFSKYWNSANIEPL
ncbi:MULTISPECIES: hypothetical protein [Vibrio]|uniref:hypothetical protein n=1 Tax=Vibrio TaxID=662 RepID=UPI001B80FCF9|nr:MULTISPECIES: hypothetical protein [Vibrio]MBS9956215.1 hypothetical protein [Vibrio alginolyticus]MDW2072869.1 hypothetical protein [Vibrio sp. 2096]MDW3143564.1 hypothetical protein [Vibrio sp. 2094]HBC3810354.1 hypothetical protein [Vibrio alginolyticus]